MWGWETLSHCHQWEGREDFPHSRHWASANRLASHCSLETLPIGKSNLKSQVVMPNTLHYYNIYNLWGEMGRHDLIFTMSMRLLV